LFLSNLAMQTARLNRRDLSIEEREYSPPDDLYRFSETASLEHAGGLNGSCLESGRAVIAAMLLDHQAEALAFCLLQPDFRADLMALRRSVRVYGFWRKSIPFEWMISNCDF